tara:strand:- start:1360 stop:1545 length:186 start_codon:yes stop_codon:yes gene_type:complete
MDDELADQLEVTPTVFISYSWDNDEHKDRVRELAESLILNRVNVIRDIWHVTPGESLSHFM